MSHLVRPRTYKLIRAVIVVWMTAVILAAFLLDIPRIRILEHTARNLYFHVPMWFTLLGAIVVSAYHSARFLSSGDPVRDLRATEAARVAMLFGLMGLVTGIYWSRFTWYQGTNIWWNFDPRQTMAVVELLIYGAYFILRGSVDDEDKRGRVAAVYNIFAACTAPFLLYVLPRQLDSLHPGAEGNPAFSEITDPIMRVVFYPAILGFFGIYWLLYTQRVRLRLIEEQRSGRLD
jgi:heme exporter protein C